MKREKILLSAFACDPVTGSECYVGWSWANQLAPLHDLTVLTRSYSADVIAAEKPGHGLKLIHFDLPLCRRKDHVWRFIKPYYVIWQVAALFVVLWHHARGRFDVVHHLTYNVVDMPGLLGLVPGAAFVWGPVGGGQMPPEDLACVYGEEWKKQKLRAAMKRMARYNPFVVIACWRARHVFFANRETAALISDKCRSWSMMLETAIDPAETLPTPRADKDPLQLLWLSNVIDRKALIIAIEAMGRLQRDYPQADCRLVVAGDGPMLAPARERAAELGLGDAVSFIGKVPFAQVLDLMQACDAFVFTSVQDTSGNVLLEAMSRGKPVICLDHQGAAEIVTPQTGAKIPVAGLDQVAEDFAAAFAGFAADRSAVASMGLAAYRHISDNHRWRSRMDHYRQTLNELGQGSNQVTEADAC